MTKIIFLFDEEKRKKRLRWKDLKIVEKLGKGGASFTDVQSLAARFMADEDRNYLPTDTAIEILDELTQEEIEDVLKQFTDAITESAVPKASGMPSNLPSQASSSASPSSPDGSQT